MKNEYLMIFAASETSLGFGVVGTKRELIASK